MKRTNIKEINKMGRSLAKKCINESRRRVLAESDNWRDNHVGGTADNSKAFERWLPWAQSQGYSPEYIESIAQLNSWVGGGAEKNGLIDWSTGFPVLRQDAYAEFADGDNNWFKRNNATERNAWFNNLAGIISQEESRRSADPYGGAYGGGYNDPYGGYGGGMPPYGMPPYGMPPYGGMPPMGPPPPPPYGGGSDDDIFRYMMINDYLRAQDVARNEAAAHPNQASGAPSLNPMLPLLMMSASGGRPQYPTNMTPGGGGMPSYGGGMPPIGPRGGSMPPMNPWGGGGARPPMRPWGGGGARPPMRPWGGNFTPLGPGASAGGRGMTPPAYGPNPALYGGR